MLPFAHKIAFLLFAVVTVTIGLRGFYRVYRRIRRGSQDSDARFDHPPQRVWYALVTTLTQSRTFRRRPAISFFHSFIFYGFVFYILVNMVDAVEGFVPFTIRSVSWPGIVYNLRADLLSALVLIGVVALVIRRFLLPSRRDFTFNQRTMLHQDVKHSRIRIDSLIVSTFILFHVGSRAVGAGAKLAVEGPDHFQPFASLLSHAFTSGNAEAWRIFGFWGALGSVLAFLMYFPFSKHIHIFAAPAKYLAARRPSSGVLPAEDLDLESDTLKAGANKLEDLAWPRLLDAYACIQCNRCQDVCPATATGKALSPSALEINKRMELNSLARHQPGFEAGESSPRPLLTFALSPEAAWACTTCGACMEVCPVQDEPMLDIIDIRRHQVMIQGDFPAQLQTAFRGMERTRNPWGINHDKRMDWAEGLSVKTIEENPQPDVLYWVGCAASYDPQSQKTARAFVQLLDHAGVNFAVLGKKESCTGDSARRSGNELLYQQLAGQNVSTLNQVSPKLIVATCPHCMNAVGKEYRQLGGNFKVMHHTEYLETLIAQGKLQAAAAPATVTYHDPCYLGRHNGVYDAPRNLLNILSNDLVELDRNRENSFCCGAGGAQFWKEEEPGTQKISDNRYREAQKALAGGENKVLAVGCPFCKSMLDSTAARGQQDAIAVKDVAELLLESVEKKLGKVAAIVPVNLPMPQPSTTVAVTAKTQVTDPVAPAAKSAAEPLRPVVERKKWEPKAAPPEPKPAVTPPTPTDPQPAKRKAWTPKAAAAKEQQPNPAETKLPDA
jgi:Fe-S oxidoreductase/nitrate reductase gamma subunit